MASRLIDWTLGHLRLMWAFVGLTFLVMLLIPDARWNAITTAWGALFVGLLISLVLEQRGEGIQRRVWLARNTDRARTAVDELLAVAAHSAAFAVDLPKEIMQALVSGATRSARREAAERARAYIWTHVANHNLPRLARTCQPTTCSGTHDRSGRCATACLTCAIGIGWSCRE